MLNLHGGEIAQLIGATVLGRIEGVTARGVSADSRTLQAGQLFFALRGGHGFVQDAFARGACAAVVERDVASTCGPLLRVPSTIAALGQLASVYRMMLDAKVIAVGGSNGKTTTKDMIAHVLSKGRRVHKARASFNNDIGLPLTVLTADPAVDFLVLELGTNRPGDMARLAAWARPDAAIITSIGEEHLEGLGSIVGVAREESELLRHVRSGGFAVLPADEPALEPFLACIRRERRITFGMSEHADVRVTDLSRTATGVRFMCGEISFQLGLHGPWNARNAAAACAMALVIGVPLREVAERLADFRGPKMRMERLEFGGFTVVNDAYNANPTSMRAALREFVELPCRGKRVAILGEMRELGTHSERLHGEIGRVVETLQGLDHLVTIGPLARPIGADVHFDTLEEAKDHVMSVVEPGDLVLIKGSRAVGLERIVKFLAERVTETRGHAAATV